MPHHVAHVLYPRMMKSNAQPRYLSRQVTKTMMMHMSVFSHTKQCFVMLQDLNKIDAGKQRCLPELLP